MAEYGLYIPPNVLKNKGLGANHKMIYAYIKAMTDNGLECFASDEYLGRKVGIQTNKVENNLKHLANFGYLEIGEKDGRRILKPTNKGLTE